MISKGILRNLALIVQQHLTTCFQQLTSSTAATLALSIVQVMEVMSAQTLLFQTRPPPVPDPTNISAVGGELVAELRETEIGGLISLLTSSLLQAGPRHRIEATSASDNTTLSI